ncbi:DUF819 family protein [Anaerosalibacter bizertensis]|uniref:DUF819 family protein n=1 Tax=Anaerosalibacter bizertensis TaxID=932217 RepID=A0A9Q4AE48_9FIRM|nr:DUF819 family protein [Anaerosalibacter bizertensis]MBV1819448.1 DUF819 family protein [Bacteroidales bacterium MSK.15.36]MCB5560175.1 DUF819 family protein [Anaerosalibacter bizertensis]MCG4565835.1 DUF819 family protein [Anaerosalibacter bizertensis]MCG4583121.1 DUF819 family protein [Anaerosalibacter bizertensis]MCG4584550.1 DUF819 family protein [Anaerosalibacter bizertensis]
MVESTLISPDNTWALWAILTGIAALSIYLEQTYPWASKVTGAIIGLVIAMALANFKIIPTDTPTYDMVWDYVVPLALPMLLFSANIKKIWKESGRIVVIFIIGGIGTALGAILGFFILRNHIPELYKMAGMMTGSYIGGGVNFVAMADNFVISKELISALVVADNLNMALYFFVLISIPSIPFFKKNFNHPLIDELERVGEDEEAKTRAAAYWDKKEISLKDIAFTIGISFIIVAISDTLAEFLGSVIPTNNFGLSLLNGLLGNKYLIITTLTMILATYLPNFFGNINGAQEIGTFLIYIFFVVIGVPASIHLIITKSPLLLLYCAIIVIINMLFILFIGKLFKFNLEEILIASNSNIGGPTTAAAMAIAKGWTPLVLPAILAGTLGYIIGNYFGIFIGNLLSIL